MTVAPHPDHRHASFWLDDVPGGITPRAPLAGPADVDVVIVGAGYTGLWTAYYLIKSDPHLRVAVLEQEVAGFGASGRSGGWVSPFFATPLSALEQEHGREAAVATQLAMFDTVDEVGRVAEAEGIDAHYRKDGMLWVSTSPAQTPRLREVVEAQSAYGFGDDWRWISRADALRRVRVEGCFGGIYSPRYASVQPARLARGLADVVEGLGVRIYEGTPAIKVEPRGVDTPVGRVRADSVILATEAYTVQIPGHERDVVAIYDLMLATEPLPASVWDEIGWHGHEVLSDGRYLFVYCQRTWDDRIALGGTVGPYHFGSRISPRYERSVAVHDRIHRALKTLFPAVSGAAVTHSWGGVLAATRDWHSGVTYDAATGMGWARGYVGAGIATANLAGRTLTDLILRRDSELLRLPWVGHRSKRWEPEPLRWIAANGMQAIMGHADHVETGKGRPVRWKRLLDKVEGIAGW